jgi:hypothetical protein
MRLLILLLLFLTVPALAQDDQEPPVRRASDLSPEERVRLRQGTHAMRAVERPHSRPRCGPDCVEKRRREWVAETAKTASTTTWRDDWSLWFVIGGVAFLATMGVFLAGSILEQRRDEKRQREELGIK